MMKVNELHEFSIVEGIVKAVLKEAGTHDRVVGIKEVELEIGELAFLNPEQLNFAFDVLRKDNILADAELVIKTVDADTKCKSCGYSGPLKPDAETWHYTIPLIACPECGGAVDILKGRECLVKNVKLIIDDDPET